MGSSGGRAGRPRGERLSWLKPFKARQRNHPRRSRPPMDHPYTRSRRVTPNLSRSRRSWACTLSQWVNEGLRPRPNGWVRLLGDRREPIAELVRDHDEVALGIEHALPPNKPFDVGVMGAIGGRIENDVRLIGRERAVVL